MTSERKGGVGKNAGTLRQDAGKHLTISRNSINNFPFLHLTDC